MSTIYVVEGPPQIPIPDVSLAKFLVENMTKYGASVAQVDSVTQEERTYNYILKSSMSVAKALQSRGIGVNDAVSICSENSLDFCLPVLGALYVGAACAPLNFTYTARELRHTLSISTPKIVFCSASTANTMAEAIQGLDYVKEIVVFGEDPKFTPFSEFLRYSGEVIALPKINPVDHVSLIMCSSGTTGLPKGVMLTDKNIICALTHIKEIDFSSFAIEDAMIGILPYFHAYGQVTMLAAFCTGLKSVVMARFQEELFLQLIQKYKVTLLFLVPPLLVFLGKHPLVTKYDLSSIKEIWSGAAPLAKDVQDAVTKRLHVTNIRQGYGMTETTLAVLRTPREKNKSGSSGILAPGTSSKVIDIETGKTLGPNQTGELCFKGELIMKGYRGNLEATAGTIDNEGWLHTGDIGYYDEEGYFYIVDRLKELIKYKGFQVPPAELEGLLLTHRDVKDAAVIGIPDEKCGELPRAFVVKRDGAKTTEADIKKFIAKQVSPQKRLYGGVKFVDSIPKTASGKILRKELRKIGTSKL